MKMTYEEVARILAIVDMAEGEDLDFTLGDTRISLTAWPAEVLAEPAPASAPAKPKAVAAASKPESEDSGLAEVQAKRLGLYRSVKGIRVGTRVNEGDVVAKLEDLDGKKHPVEAPAGGRIVELCMKAGDFAEYGQSLLTIDTSTTDSEQGMTHDPADAVSQA